MMRKIHCDFQGTVRCGLQLIYVHGGLVLSAKRNFFGRICLLFFCLAQGKPKDDIEHASYFEHFISWWKHRRDSYVLFLFYEKMKEDLETVVKATVLFIGRIQNTVRMSTFEFEKK